MPKIILYAQINIFFWRSRTFLVVTHLIPSCKVGNLVKHFLVTTLSLDVTPNTMGHTDREKYNQYDEQKMIIPLLIDFP